jgi:hypothetical protein
MIWYVPLWNTLTYVTILYILCCLVEEIKRTNFRDWFVGNFEHQYWYGKGWFECIVMLEALIGLILSSKRYPKQSSSPTTTTATICLVLAMDVGPRPRRSMATRSSCWSSLRHLRSSDSEWRSVSTKVKASFFLALHSCRFFFVNHFSINLILASPNCSPRIFLQLSIFFGREDQVITKIFLQVEETLTNLMF